MNAAVDPWSCSVSLYHPGTPSMVEALSLVQLAAMELGMAGCQKAVASVVSTNLIAGALAVGRLSRHVFSGPQPAALFTFETRGATRGGVMPLVVRKRASQYRWSP